MFKILKYIFVIFSITVLSWIAGFIYFVKTLPLTSLEPARSTDAIVVWTGGACRISTGFDLLVNGVSDKLFISGIKGDKTSSMFRRNCGSNLTRSQIDALLIKTYLGSQAKTTIGNALETAQWAQKNDIKTIRLVTSSLHMPRSLLVSKRYLSGITVLIHPVEIDKFNHTHWYKDWNVFSKVALEYTKYLTILLGFQFQLKEDLDSQS